MEKVQQDILPRIRESVNWMRIVQDGHPLLVGISGGPDSIALADVLERLSGELGFRILLVHYNHGTREEESDRDQDFVREFAWLRDLQVEIGVGDVPQHAIDTGMSIEMAARKLRYEFFEKIASENKCKFLALGHNADDQVENLLLRLLRGAGGQGIGSLQPIREYGKLTLVRPMLPFFRYEILAYMKWRELDYRIDTTNLEDTTDRGKVRNIVLPSLLETLQKTGWGSPLESLARSASLLAEDESFFSGIVTGFMSELEQKDESKINLPVIALSSVHPAILGRVVLRSIQNLDPEIRPERGHVDRIIMMVMGVPVGSVDLPGGFRAELSGENVVIHKPAEAAIPEHVSVDINNLPASARFGEYTVTIDHVPEENLENLRLTRTLPDIEPSHGRVYISIPDDFKAMFIRSVKPGDRMDPMGMDGHSKKIQDIFVDKKIPKYKRPLEPVIEIETHKSGSFIACVPGLGLISERVKFEPDSERLIYISVK